MGSGTDTVRFIFDGSKRYALLTPQEEKDLARAVQAGMTAQEALNKGDDSPELRQLATAGQRAKNRLIASNLRLITHIAAKYQHRGMPLEELIQEGSLGLIRAAEKFDPDKGFKFSTYAYHWIRQAITRGIAEKARVIRVPVHIHEKMNKFKKATRELSQELGRSPSLPEIAEAMEIPLDTVRELLRLSADAISLDKPSPLEDESPLGSIIADPKSETLLDDMADAESRQLIRELIERLPTVECEMLKLRLGLDTGHPLNLAEIATLHGKSRERVRQILGQARRHLEKSVRRYYARGHFGYDSAPSDSNVPPLHELVKSAPKRDRSIKKPVPETIGEWRHRGRREYAQPPIRVYTVPPEHLETAATQPFEPISTATK